MASRRSIRSTDEGRKVATGNSKFALQLYRKLCAKSRGASICFSPFSVSVAMAMTSLNTREQTSEQIKYSLCLSEVADDKLLKVCGELQELLKGSSATFTFPTATRLFADKSLSFPSSFLTKTKQHCTEKLKTVDFKGDTEKSIGIINTWVEKKTGKTVPGLIPSGGLDDKVSMLLVNAVAFKAKWKDAFSIVSSQEAKFTTATGEVSAQFMTLRMRKNLWRHNQLEYTVVELPYAQTNLSMYVLLPPEDVSLVELEPKLDPASLDVKCSLMDSGVFDTRITLPKFANSETHQLQEALRELGMERLFDPESCQLFGTGPDHTACVTGVIHGVVLGVEEKGTDAGKDSRTAATSESSRPPTVDFRCDRPFLYWILDNKTGAVLFLGRYMGP